MSKKTIVAGLVFGLSMGSLAPRADAQQLGAPTILVLDERNGVNYNEDTADVTKFATSSAIVPVSLMPSWWAANRPPWTSARSSGSLLPVS